MSTDATAWLGRQRKTDSQLESWPAQALTAVLNLDAVDAPWPAELPLLWHWLYFLETVARDEVGPDGHPKLGGFMPPLANPRRMFAGARTQVSRPLRFGQAAQLVETVRDIQHKQGSSGGLTIVTVLYEYFQDRQLCISEQRDFVYLPAVALNQPSAAMADTVEPIPASDWSLDFPTDPVVLFRFSALTFNSHRIHYDQQYAREQEAYPALVVQGPLTAMLAAECLRRNTVQRVESFAFRALNPVFVGQPIRIRANVATDGEVKLTGYTPAGKPSMQVTAVLT